MQPVRLLPILLLIAASASCQTIGSGVTIGAGVTLGVAPPPSGNSLLTITQTGTGGGTVTSSPAAINCGSTCAANFTTGTAVTLTATPQTNSTFDGWSGACSGTGTCGVTMSVNKTTTALFTDHTPSSGVTLSPAPGTYTGSQTVTMTQSFGAGNSIFYTTDGTPASEASTLYNGPITVAASQTINYLVESVGSVRQETQTLPDIGNDTSKGWKMCTPLYNNSNGSPTSGSSTQCGGGVGSDQPSTWSVVPGSTETLSISSTGGFPQFLYTLGGSGCDSCTKITQDKWIKPVSGGNMQNYEMDEWHVDHTRHKLHMIGWQCNQQSGKLQWQYDNAGNGWVNTGVSDGCPLSTTQWTHVIFHAHWIIGDTGCGGNGCNYYDDIWVGHASSPGVATTMTQHIVNATLPTNTNTTWGPNCAQQDQEDLPSGGTVGSPKTAGELIQHNNVTCSFGTQTTGTAAYTIH